MEVIKMEIQEEFILVPKSLILRFPEFEKALYDWREK